MSCEARQYSDQKVCHRCGLVWDMNDPEPPACLTSSEVGRRALDELRALLDAPQRKGTTSPD